MTGSEQKFRDGLVFGWFWTGLAASAAIGLFYLGQALAGVTLVLSALAACPPVVATLEKRTGASLGGGLRLALVIVFAGLAVLSFAQNPAGLAKLAAVTAPAPLQPKTLLVDQGDFGNKTTKLFTPQGKDWDLLWSFDCTSLGDSGNFSARVMRQGGGALENAVVEKISDHDSGTEHYHQGGTLYLQVVSECQWTVKVVG
jgi:hypothetical protein